jgi:hypothetical protein
MAELTQIPFVLVQAEDYEKNQSENKNIRLSNQLFAFLRQNYIEVDRYTASVAPPYSFIMLKKRG